MPKKLPAYILVLLIGATAVLVAAFGKFGDAPVIRPTEETVTGEIGSFPPGFTGSPTTERNETIYTLPPASDNTDDPSGFTIAPTGSGSADGTPEQPGTDRTSDVPGSDRSMETDPGTLPPSGGNETPSVPEETTVSPAANEVETDSSAYCVIDDSGNVILAKNPYAHLQPASMTKVLTALVVAENVSSLDVSVTVSERAVSLPMPTRRCSGQCTSTAGSRKSALF